jgi:RecJ-like exonuclease
VAGNRRLLSGDDERDKEDGMYKKVVCPRCKGRGVVAVRGVKADIRVMSSTGQKFAPRAVECERCVGTGMVPQRGGLPDVFVEGGGEKVEEAA